MGRAPVRSVHSIMVKGDVRLATAFAQTFALQVFQSLMSVATGILIARGLGPVGQGTYATLLAGVAVGSVVASLGHFQGNVLAIASRRNSARALLHAAVVHAVALLALLALTQRVWRPWIGLFDGSPLVPVFALVLSLEVLAQLVRGINLGQHQVLAFNLVTFVQRLALFVGVIGLHASRRLSVLGVASVWALSVAAGVAFSAGAIWRRSPRVPVSIRDVGRNWRLAFGHGRRALVVITLTLLLVRCDIWMLRAMLGVAAVGQISIAVGLAEWLWYVPGILNNLLFATVAADHGQRSVARVCRASRLVIAGTVPVTFVLLVFGRTIVERLYGAEFAPAGLLFVLLVPGMEIGRASCRERVSPRV